MMKHDSREILKFNARDTIVLKVVIDRCDVSLPSSRKLRTHTYRYRQVVQTQ